MSKRDPCVFLVRHGETQWSINGKHTGKTDIELTPNGRLQLSKMAMTSIGEHKLICPSTLSLVLVSPLKRARETLDLLRIPNLNVPSITLIHEEGKVPVLITPDVCEWDYGDYEGVTSHEIHKTNPTWSLFNDGAPNGESPNDVSRRVDNIIEWIQRIHKEYKNEENSGMSVGKGDVLIVAHGHILRSLTAKWIGLDVKFGHHFLLDAGAVSKLSYEHHKLDEPAIALWNGRW